MKQNSCIYILSLHPVFNKELVPVFSSFSKENSSDLYSALVINNKELTDQLTEITNTVFCFNENDKDFLDDKFQNTENFFINSPAESSPLKILSEKYFHSFSNNIIIFSDSIGFSPEDIKNTFNLLCMEDESIVIGKSLNRSLAFLGFNSLTMEMVDNLDLSNLDYDSFLNKIVKFEHFIHVLKDFMLIKNLEDFKTLYDNLSKKESFSYCSQNIHERFTNLFIEYKDLLK